MWKTEQLELNWQAIFSQFRNQVTIKNIALPMIPWQNNNILNKGNLFYYSTCNAKLLRVVNPSYLQILFYHATIVSNNSRWPNLGLSIQVYINWQSEYDSVHRSNFQALVKGSMEYLYLNKGIPFCQFLLKPFGHWWWVSSWLHYLWGRNNWSSFRPNSWSSVTSIEGLIKLRFNGFEFCLQII